MAKLRTFVGMEIPTEVSHRVVKAIDSMKTATESVRWVATDNLHLTLKFLGDVEDREIYSICRATIESVRDIPTFAVFCEGVGAFPTTDKPRTIWVGIKDREERLAQLFHGLEAKLSDLGFPQEPRKFMPHLTLGRVQHGRRNLGELVNVMQTLAEYEVGWLPIESLTIFTSELTRSGPVYTVMGRAPLG